MVSCSCHYAIYATWKRKKMAENNVRAFPTNSTGILFYPHHCLRRPLLHPPGMHEFPCFCYFSCITSSWSSVERALISQPTTKPFFHESRGIHRNDFAHFRRPLPRNFKKGGGKLSRPSFATVVTFHSLEKTMQTKNVYSENSDELRIAVIKFRTNSHFPNRRNSIFLKMLEVQ